MNQIKSQNKGLQRIEILEKQRKELAGNLIKILNNFKIIYFILKYFKNIIFIVSKKL
jgi:hypothetical protein